MKDEAAIGDEPQTISELSRNRDSEAAPVDAPTHGHQLSISRKVVLVCVLAGASFLSTIAVQSTVIVLPSIGEDLKVPEFRQQWIVSAYNLTFACFLLQCSRLADVYGRRLIFLLGSLWMTVCLLVAPFMPDEISFDLFRGLQGVGAAANVPTAIGIIGSTYPEGNAKTYAISAYGAGFPLGSVIGNILGGILAQYTNWHWVFWVSAVLAFSITIAGYFAIPRSQDSISDSRSESLSHLVDWVGGILITLGLLALMAALTEGNVVGWATAYIPVLFVIAAVLIILFLFWISHLERGGNLRSLCSCFELHRRNRRPQTFGPSRPQPLARHRPLIKPSIFRKNHRVAYVQFIQALSFSAFNNFLIFATFTFQNHQHLDPIQTTLRFIPTGVAGLLIVLVTSYVLSRVPGFVILTVGCTAVAIACLLFAAPIPDGTTYWAYGFPAMVLSVVGADTVSPCLTLFTIQSLDQEDQAMGGGIVNASGQVGRAVGLAIATAVQVAVERHVLAGGNAGGLVLEHEDVAATAQLAGYRAADYISLAFACVATLIALIAFPGAGVVGKRAA